MLEITGNSTSIKGKDLFSNTGPYKKKICLNMIVKNESSVIKRCLEPIKGHIDYWVIVDTGSTDGTQEVIREYMKGILGELHERSWVNFEHNRNEALNLARHKADYTLFIDADELLIFSPDFVMPRLDKDIYSILVKQKDAADAEKWFMINNELDWRWEGVLHETITCTAIRSKELIQDVFNYSDTSLGARSRDPNKYLHDAEILKKELKKDPTHCRYQFYLAVSYLNANDLLQALEHFEKRAEMEGEDREKFMALFMVARLRQHFKRSPESFISYYLRAHECCPFRAEALFYLADYYLGTEQYELGYQTLQKTPTEMNFIPYFIEAALYEWRVEYFLARACLHLQKYQEMKNALEKVLLAKNVPADVLEETRKNLTILKSQVLVFAD